MKDYDELLIALRRITRAIDDLTDEMLLALKEKRPFTERMRVIKLG